MRANARRLVNEDVREYYALIPAHTGFLEKRHLSLRDDREGKIIENIDF